MGIEMRDDKVGALELPEKSGLEEEFLAVAELDGELKCVLLGQDGTYRVVDGTEQIHNILYVVTSETLAMRESVEELEYLMNHPGAKEQDFQDFFERNPGLILNDEYKRAHPHITLAREEGPLIPDFLLELCQPLFIGPRCTGFDPLFEVGNLCFVQPIVFFGRHFVPLPENGLI